MKTALRVLTALNEKRHPGEDDVKKLRLLAGPKFETTNLDELACEVIQKALKHRAMVRGA